MTLSSDNNHYNTTQFRKILQTINQIIDIIGGFGDNYDKKLNFSKLARLLKISPSEIDDVIYLLLNFQEKFEITFRNYHLKKKRENSQVYLIAERNQAYNLKELHIPNVIEIDTFQLKLFNDIIYTFKFIKRGKGFDIVKNGTNLSTNLKALLIKHPYFFELKENGLIYPSHFGLKLGNIILSYNKGNKEFKKIIIENHTIMVVNDGRK